MTGANVDSVSKESLGQAIGRLSSGVYIATLVHEGKKEGMLATWIIQAAFEPPMLTMAVQSQRDILQHLGVNARFSVNALSKRNMDIFKAFARPYQPDEDRFAGLNLAHKESAGPVFAEALSFVDCKVASQMVAGDHTIVIAEITGGELLNGDEPMLHTRKNGFQY